MDASNMTILAQYTEMLSRLSGLILAVEGDSERIARGEILNDETPVNYVTFGDKEYPVRAIRINDPQGETGIVCCNCGGSEAVEFGPDPFASEIRGDETPVWECKACRIASVRET